MTRDISEILIDLNRHKRNVYTRKEIQEIFQLSYELSSLCRTCLDTQCCSP